MRISIDSSEVKVKSGIGKNDKPYEICTQVAYLDTGKRYPGECKIRVPDKSSAFAPGEYVIDFDKSLYVDRFGHIAVSEELVLQPLGFSVEEVKRGSPVKAA